MNWKYKSVFVVLTAAIAESREVVDAKCGSLRPPSAPVGSWLTCVACSCSPAARSAVGLCFG